jgi:general L-amino acid transport system permease protein
MATIAPSATIEMRRARRRWSRRKLWEFVYQALVLAAVVAFVTWIALNTIENLNARGMTSGFEFLWREAGFGIGFSLIPYDEASTYGRAFLVGLLNTIFVAAVAIVLATATGFGIGIARLSSNWPSAKAALLYVEFIRNIPLLLQLLFWYAVVLRALPTVRQSLDIGGIVFLNNRGIFLPAPEATDAVAAVGTALAAAIAGTIALARGARHRQETTGRRAKIWPVALALIVGLPAAATGFAGVPFVWSVPELRGFSFEGGIGLMPELAALVLALTIYNAAFVAEIVRCGIQAIPHGQTEAALALGLRRGALLRLVIVPQATRIIVPPLTNQHLHLLKASALATAIGYPDLVNVFMGTVLNQTGRAIEIVAVTMAIYLVLSLAIAVLAGWYHRAHRLMER